METVALPLNPGLTGPDPTAAALAEIRRLTADLILPEAACGTRTRLFDGRAEYIDDPTEHMQLQNTVLLPQVEPAGRADA